MSKYKEETIPCYFFNIYPLTNSIYEPISKILINIKDDNSHIEARNLNYYEYEKDEIKKSFDSLHKIYIENGILMKINKFDFEELYQKCIEIKELSKKIKDLSSRILNCELIEKKELSEKIKKVETENIWIINLTNKIFQ